MKRTEKEIMQEFSSLTGQLSPENLHCDGEISPAQAQQRYRQIMKRWKECEKELGRPVTEDEVYAQNMKRN